MFIEDLFLYVFFSPPQPLFLNEAFYFCALGTIIVFYIIPNLSYGSKEKTFPPST